MFGSSTFAPALIIALGLLSAALIATLIFLRFRRSAMHQDGLKKWRELQRIYFEIQETLLKMIASGQPFNRCAAEFTNSLTGKLKIEKLIIYINDRNRFSPMIWHEISIPGINKLYYAGSSEHLRRLAATGKPIWFEKSELKDNLSRLLCEKMGMKVLFPMVSRNRLDGLVIISQSSCYELEDITHYILALTDQLSQAFDISERAGSPDKMREDRTPMHERNRNAEPRRYDEHSYYSLLFEANKKLLRIYNESYLMESFMGILEKHLKPSFAFVFLPIENADHLRIIYKTDALPSQLEDCQIKISDSLIGLLTRQQGVHKMEFLAEALGMESSVRNLSEAGCQLVAAFMLPSRQIGFMGLGERISKPGYYTAEDVEVVAALCQTLRLVLDNIHQFKKIEELSYTDSMTGLYNYRYFYKRLGEEVLRAKRFDRHLALVIYDIDDFKVVNDNYGHQTGDYILKQLASLMLECVRSIDVVSRYGGEEFCVIMPETDEKACEQFMERLRKKVSEHLFKDRFEAKNLNISLSLGGAIYPSDAQRIDRLIYCADMALLAAKKSGRNRTSIYSSIGSKTTA